MDKGAGIYKEFIDKLVEMSRQCPQERALKKGCIPWMEESAPILNGILEKLNQRERDALGDLALDAYHSAIHDTLALLEWMRCCKDMTITADGEILPIGGYEGMHCDYIGRRDDWQWPDE